MSKKLKNNAIENEETVATEANLPAQKKADKPAAKKDNFFKRIGKKLVKLCKDTVGEMKKVVWTPKAEVKKSTQLVIVTVVAIGLAIALIDTGFSYLINTIAGLIG